MSAADHQFLLRSYLDKRHREGAKAIDALVEMQEWVTANIKAEHTRVWNIARAWEVADGICQEGR